MDVAGVILAGGRGKRMGGVNKAFLEVEGQPIIDRLLAVYAGLFQEILIAVRDPEPFAGLAARPPHPRLAPDRFAARSSLTGIHAGLAQARAGHVFVCACDTPFLEPGLVRMLLQGLTPRTDVRLPIKADGYYEPLCAVYSKRCLPFIEESLNRGDMKIISFFGQVQVETALEAELRAADPELRSFLNVNTPEDLAQARSGS
jgi:molybdopterin-guanine dinucleotide biosynthesis protein A